MVRASSKTRTKATTKSAKSPNGSKAPPTTLSKTRYLSGIQCAKRLYYETSPSSAAKRARTASTQNASVAIEQGIAVGELARRRFPGGVLVSASPNQHAEAVAETQRAMASGASAIFEAAFEHCRVQVRVDVLERTAKGWRLVEVKSSTEVKDEHHADAAIQAFVLQGAGVPITDAGVLHLDSAYVRGNSLNLQKLFRFESMWRKVEPRLPTLRKEVDKLHRIAGTAAAPSVAPGVHCNKPHPCPFKDTCIPPPAPLAVTRLPGGARLAEKHGVSQVSQLRSEHKLTAQQARAVQALKTGKDQVSRTLAKKLGAAEFPIYFLDFETMMPAVPRYAGTRAYQALPCQWSLHILDQDGTLGHQEFLHDDDTDPRDAFASSLLTALGKKGTICVYSSFERTQLRSIADWKRSFAPSIRQMEPRLYDLLEVIKDGYYHPRFDGSFSIKAVLPALTSLTYQDLEIHNGAEAAAAYERMIGLAAGSRERKKINRDLRAYCERDTLAMVEVRKALLQKARR